jgi:hypothetical protein
MVPPPQHTKFNLSSAIFFEQVRIFLPIRINNQKFTKTDSYQLRQHWHSVCSRMYKLQQPLHPILGTEQSYKDYCDAMRYNARRVIPLLSLRAFMACEKGETYLPIYLLNSIHIQEQM